MPASERDYEILWGYSLKKQTNYATPLIDADLTKSLLFLGPDILERTPRLDNNSDEFGKGHPYVTKQKKLAWDNKIQRHFKCVVEALGFIASFAAGSVVSIQPNGAGNPTVWSHAIQPLAFTSKDMVVTTIVEKLNQYRTKKIPSIAVADFTLSGEGVNYVDLMATLVGSGAQATFAGSVPSAAVGNFLWTHGATFELGNYGAGFTNLSARLKKWSFKWDNAPKLDDGFFPGSGFAVTGEPASGAIRGRLERGVPKMDLSFDIRVESDQQIQDLENGQELKLKLTLNGEIITVGQPELYSAILEIFKFEYKAVPVGIDDNMQVYRITAEVYYDSVATNPWKLTVVNKDVAYLVAA